MTPELGARPRASAEAPRAGSQSRAGRFPTAFRSVSPDTWALVAIAAAVTLANLPYLLGFFHSDPLDFRAGLNRGLSPGLLAGKSTIDPSNGFTSQAIGHLAALDLLHLHLPWWNPYEATGMPLLGETQSAALFPLTLFTALANGQLYEHLVLELIAGICTYRLLRRLDVAMPAALAGAIAFALNGKFAWFADAGVNPLPFLPMLLLGIERAYAAAREGRHGGWRLLAVAGALSAYAGFPEVAYPDALMAGAWLLWRCGCLDRRRELPHFVAKAALGAVAGLLLAAPILVAMGGYLSHADLGVHTGGALGSRHLGVVALPQLLLPYVYGQINSDPHATTWLAVGGYISTTLLLLAVLGAIAPGRRGLTGFLLAWLALVFAHMYGVPGLGRVLGVLPEMSRIQFYRYATAALELPVILLAALGVDWLARAPGDRRRLLAGGLGVAAAIGAAALHGHTVVAALGSAYHHRAYFDLSVIWGGLTALAVAGAALLRAARLRATLLVALVAVDALALFVVPEFAAPRATQVDLSPAAFLQAHAGESRFYTLGPIAPDYGSYFGLASFGVDDFPPTLYADYVHAHVSPGAAFVGFGSNARQRSQELLHHLAGYRQAAVRYVVTPASLSLPQSATTLRLVFASASARIYELAGARPYFGARGCTVGSSARTRARVDCSRSSTLVRRETSMAGWSAAVDGHSATIRRVDGVFQAVAVPAGVHEISFNYTPPEMHWALLGLLGGCGLMVAPLGRRLRRPRVGPPAPAST